MLSRHLLLHVEGASWVLNEQIEFQYTIAAHAEYGYNQRTLAFLQSGLETTIRELNHRLLLSDFILLTCSKGGVLGAVGVSCRQPPFMHVIG